MDPGGFKNTIGTLSICGILVDGWIIFLLIVPTIVSIYNLVNDVFMLGLPLRSILSANGHV